MTSLVDESSILAPDGALQKVLPRYEHRPGQLQMAQAVRKALEDCKVLLVEAGTGTGKTLAYLSGAVATDKQIVISTGTKNLQDQLLGSDIPLLEKALGRELSVVCLKGLSNYLCRRKLETLSNNAPLLSDREVAFLDKIQTWAATTETGDRAELSDISENHPMLSEVFSNTDTRLGPKCRFHEDCFVTKARKAAQDARIIVVNHYLFFADLALRSGPSAILPPYDAVIFDEAHQIDTIATEFFGYRVSSRNIEDLVRDCRRAIASMGDQSKSNEAEPLLEHLLQSSNAFFSLLDDAQSQPGKTKLFQEELSGKPEQNYFRLDSDLEALAAHLGGLPTIDEAIVTCGRRAEALRNDLGEILGQQHPASVYWKEVGPRSTAIGASPIDVSSVVRENVFYQTESVVLTSATLAVDGSFSYIRERLGIDFDTNEQIVASPFDYTHQSALYVPEDAPDPRRSRYIENLAELITETISIVQTGTLVLFTNQSHMKSVASLVRRQSDRFIRVQGERSRRALLEELRGSEDPLILFATSSFWQGVDVPGSALELVIITRLPFASPQDPVVGARLRAIEEEGRSPFVEYQIPQATLALKQGFGRLIRTKHDRGVVALFDKRLQSMGYGQVFLRSLPECSVLRSANELSTWWEQNV